MADYTFAPSPVLIETTGEFAIGAEGVLRATAEGAPVAIYDMNDSPITEIVVGPKGAHQAFKADIPDGVLDFGSVLVPTQSLEAMRAGLTALSTAEAALEAATSIDAADLTATGPLDAVHFLRGDNVWAVPPGTGGGGGGGGDALALINVTDYGATGDGVTDDTVAINNAMSAAHLRSGRNGATVFFPLGRYLVSSPINLYSSVSVLGEGWSMDTDNYHVSALIAKAGFVGSAILKANAGGAVVSDPDPRPDMSWHWATIEKIVVKGLGASGPHGIDLGWNGEASSVHNVQVIACNSGFYMTSTQASAALYSCSAFWCAVGVNFDGIQNTARLIGISGDNNTSLIRAKGGVSANITIVGMKAENYDAGTGDPVINIVDYEGGLTVLGGWCDTSSARNAVVRITSPGAVTFRPRVVLVNVGKSGFYSYMIDDVVAGTTLTPTTSGGGRYPFITWNADVIHGGEGQVRLPRATDNTTGSTAYTLQLSDAERVVEPNSGATVTITVPSNTFSAGDTVVIRQYGAGQVTIAAGVGTTARSRGGALKLAGQYAEATITFRTANEFIVSGDVTT